MTKIAKIELSHPDKFYYPKAKVTKLDLAKFYHQYRKLILPYLIKRPLSVFRCPEGVGHDCFFQKHQDTLSKNLGTVTIKEKQAKRKYIYIKNEENLISLVQNGSLEFHTWGCKISSIENPDKVIFDLDPAASSTFEQLKNCAYIIRAGLNVLKLKSFIKTSGKKGLHIWVPLSGKHSWEQVKEFALHFAQKVESVDPDHFTTTISKTRRRHKILIDYLRNERGATCVVPYSTRATENASISTPISWKELKNLKSSDFYTVNNISSYSKKISNNPWKNYHAIKQSLPKMRAKSKD